MEGIIVWVVAAVLLMMTGGAKNSGDKDDRDDWYRGW